LVALPGSEPDPGYLADEPVGAPRAVQDVRPTANNASVNKPFGLSDYAARINPRKSADVPV